MEGKQKPRMLGWSLIYIALLLSIFFPPLSMVTVCLVMVPVLIMYVKLDVNRFIVHYAICLIVTYLMATILFVGWGGSMILSLSIFFLPATIQMGNLYKKRASARSVITAGAVTLLVELLLVLIAITLFGMNPIGKMKQFMANSIQTISPQLQSMMGMDADEMIRLMVQMLPLYMIGFSVFYAVISHAIGRRILVHLGESIPAFKPIREWMLPKSLIWIYLLAMVLEMFVKDTGSLVYTVLVNLLPLLTTIFSVQAVAFLFFIAHTRRWNKTLPIIGIIILVFFSPAYFVFSLLGIFDVAFPIRERLTRR